MKKKTIVILAIVVAATLCVSVWLLGYYSSKSGDNIPSKELMVSYFQNQGADYAAGQLRGYTQAQLIEAWGEPDSFLSGLWGDIWKTNNPYYLIVYYDNNAAVEHVMVKNQDS